MPSICSACCAGCCCIWPPLLLVSMQVFQAESRGPCRALPVNSVPIPFESDMFSGVLVVYIRHLATTPSHLFKGKKRLNWIALQVMARWLVMHFTISHMLGSVRSLIGLCQITLSGLCQATIWGSGAPLNETNESTLVAPRPCDVVMRSCFYGGAASLHKLEHNRMTLRV